MKNIFLILTSFILLSCNDKIAGTLGGGNAYVFDCNKKQLSDCLETFTKTSKNLYVPKKWKIYNNWEQIGYSFLKGKVFYIKGKEDFEEEMYYVTVFDNFGTVTKSNIAVRSVFRIVDGKPRWLYFEHLSNSDAKKVEERFQKIVLKNIMKNDCGCSQYEIEEE